MTPAEAALWYHLRAHRFGGVKFRRQTVIGPFIADFTCRAAMLVIEIEGDSHAERVERDEQRTLFMQERGWRVIRFTNSDVMTNLDAVLERLRELVAPLPNLSPEGRGNRWCLPFTVALRHTLRETGEEAVHAV